jgi:hypothetical protein
MGDPFDDLAAGLPDDRNEGDYGGWLRALEAAAGEDAIF